MRILIYTVAVGTEYRELAEMMVRSLRRQEVCADIVAVADRALDAPCKSIVVHATRLAEMGFGGRDVLYLRAAVERLVPGCMEADLLVHVDADVLCIGPIDAILNDLARRRVIAVQKYPRPLSAVGQNFTAADWGRVRGHPFAACGGIVAFPGGEMGREFLRLWDFECGARRFDDQTALNVVLHRGYAGRFEFFPRAGFWPGDEGAALVHFLGYRAEMARVFEERYGR